MTDKKDNKHVPVTLKPVDSGPAAPANVNQDVKQFPERSDEGVAEDMDKVLEALRANLRAGKPTGWERE